jgi:polygalacturonase
LLATLVVPCRDQGRSHNRRSTPISLESRSALPAFSILAFALAEAWLGGRQLPLNMPNTSRRLSCSFLAFALAAFVAHAGTGAAPARPVIPTAVFDITAAPYLAKADGTTDNTAAIQAAIDAASAAGGGTVLFPPAAQPYLSGPLVLASKINFRVESGAVVQPLPFDRYPLGGARYADWLTAKGATDLEISGAGVIDGQGQAWWEAFRANKEMPHRPYLIKLSSCTRVLVHEITLRDSPMFHLVPDRCNDVTIEHITITAPGEGAHNTDGIDPSGARHLIRHCTISVGDDNIAIKAGSEFCTDMVITDCDFGAGHGLSIGGQSTKGLDGLVVERCRFKGTTSGLRMKADPTQGGLVQNVRYSDITMEDVTYPIVFYSYYKNVGNPGRNEFGPEKAAEWNTKPPLPLDTKTMPVWRNISIENLTVKGATGRSVIWGLPRADAMICGVTLRNISYAGDFGIRIFNAHDVQFTGATSFAVAQEEPVVAFNALAIVAQPKSQTVKAASSATFSVTATGGSGMDPSAPTFQWLHNGKPLADGPVTGGATVAGAKTATLTVAGVKAATAGTYAVQVSSKLDVFDTAAGALAPATAPVAVTSQPATLTVTPTGAR